MFRTLEGSIDTSDNIFIISKDNGLKGRRTNLDYFTLVSGNTWGDKDNHGNKKAGRSTKFLDGTSFFLLFLLRLALNKTLAKTHEMAKPYFILIQYFSDIKHFRRTHFDVQQSKTGASELFTY